MRKLKETKKIVIAACIMVGVFVLDIMVPTAIAVGVMYLFSFLFIYKQSKTTISLFAIGTILLSIIKFVFFLTPSISYVVYVNRGISIASIFTIVFITYKKRMQYEYFHTERNAHEKQLEEMLFIISHEVRKPITNCIGLMNHLESDQTFSQAELRKMVTYLKVSIYELETFTQKLTVFVDDLKQEDKIRVKP